MLDVRLLSSFRLLQHVVNRGLTSNVVMVTGGLSVCTTVSLTEHFVGFSGWTLDMDLLTSGTETKNKRK